MAHTHFIEIKRKKQKGDVLIVGKIFGPKDGHITLLKVESGSTLTEVSRKLRSHGIIPSNVAINKKDKTEFTPTNTSPSSDVKQ